MRAVAAEDGRERDEAPPLRYRRLMMELLLAREAAGGPLRASEEARRADVLDQVWWMMTDAEQDEYEREIGLAVARAWRRRTAVPLGPSPSPRPFLFPLTVGDWRRRRLEVRRQRAERRAVERSLSPTAESESRDGLAGRRGARLGAWLQHDVGMPRWLWLAAWATHMGLWYWVGRVWR